MTAFGLPPDRIFTSEGRNFDDGFGQKIDIFGQAAIFFDMLDHTRALDSIRLLCEAAPDFGVTGELCLENTGLVSFDLYNTDTRVSTSQEMDVIANFLRHAPQRQGLGIEIGRRYTPQVFGIWGYAILSAPDLRSGLLTAVDFVGLSYMLAEMSLRQQPEHILAVFDTSYIPRNIKGFVLERQLTVMQNFGNALGMDKITDGFDFCTTETDAEFAAGIENMLHYKVQTGCDFDAIKLPVDVLDLPSPGHDPNVLAQCLQQCRKLLQHGQTDEKTWDSRVRESIFLELNNDPGINSVAERLEVTERTLRRRLAAEGKSYRDILGEVRLSMAHELLETTNLDVTGVTWRVGYSEPSAFVRAFTKKYGYSPGKLKG